MKLNVDPVIKKYVYNSSKQIIDPNSSIEVELVEIPPHRRTLRMRDDINVYHSYRKIPYTQFYFSKYLYYVPAYNGPEYKSLVFISNTNEPITKTFCPYHTIFFTNIVLCGAGICWGDMEIEINDKYKTISDFWLSDFYEVKAEVNEEKPARFRIIQ